MLRHSLFFLICCGAVLTGQSWAEEPSGQEADEAAIRKAAASYAEAFNKHDAQALSEHWSPDAVYTNRTTGEEVVGQAAIGEQFKALFEGQPEAKLEVTVDSVQFVSPNVAIEQGTSKMLSADGEPEEIEYSAVNVKRDGMWLLDRVTDKTSEVQLSHYEHLKELEWMFGDWTDESEGAEVELDCHWAKNKNFITRAFKISVDGETDLSGMQIIGWDPAAKKIRSWTFDSNGTFTEGTWEHRGNRWFVQNHGTLPDGRSATMINVMKPVDENSFTWQTIERTAGGELLPNLDEILIVRK